MIAVLTPTGDRPQTLALTRRWLLEQDYAGELVWIVVDDGQERSEIAPLDCPGWQLEHVRMSPGRGRGSLPANLLTGVAVAGDHAVVVLEDDDHYRPDWLSAAVAALERAQLVGQRVSRYYHLPTGGYRELPGEEHASLCATAWRPEVSKLVAGLVGAAPVDPFVDLRLWATARRRGYRLELLEGHWVTGMKGLPGRPGIGGGHRPSSYRTRDHDRAVLRRWVGDAAADTYLSLCGGRKPAQEIA